MSLRLGHCVTQDFCPHGVSFVFFFSHRPRISRILVRPKLHRASCSSSHADFAGVTEGSLCVLSYFPPNSIFSKGLSAFTSSLALPPRVPQPGSSFLLRPRPQAPHPAPVLRGAVVRRRGAESRWAAAGGRLAVGPYPALHTRFPLALRRLEDRPDHAEVWRQDGADRHVRDLRFLV